MTFQGRPKPTVLIVVTSAPGNFDNRQFIRSTWANMSYILVSSTESFSYEVIFLLGRPTLTRLVNGKFLPLRDENNMLFLNVKGMNGCSPYLYIFL